MSPGIGTPSRNSSFAKPCRPGGRSLRAGGHAPQEVGRPSIPDPRVDAPLSFRSWAFRAHLKFIKARTPFSAFLSRTLHLCRRGVCAPAHVLFPLPLPYPAIFQSRLALSSRRRAVVAERRLLHILVMALNFLHQDCHFVPLELLQRPPNAPQARCLSYLGALVRTYGSEQEGVIPSTAGRRIHVLQARLGELSNRLADLGPVGDIYSWAPPSDPVVPPDTLPEDQQPYQPAQAERLQISGRGLWDPMPFLPPDLQMAYAEPRSLLFGGLPGPEAFPDCTRESADETLKLALLWSSQGLLHLEPFAADLHPSCYTRIFAARKSSGKLRQIGDRRGPNFAEARLPGPSRWLPSGEVLTALSCRPACEGLCLCITDRRDFYHQLRCTPEKARLNRLQPALPAQAFAGSQALLDLQQRLADSSSPLGPFGLGLDPSHSRPKGDLKVQACFSSVLQGDHLGVEVATASHSAYLESKGLLIPRQRLQANQPVLNSHCHQGLIIDDFFAIAKISRSAHAGLTSSTVTPAKTCMDTALAAYQAAGLEGSAEKDVVNATIGSVAGAEVDSRSSTLARGLCVIGAPRSKRFVLADLSLETCLLPATTDSLNACLLGSWTSACTFRRPCFCAFSKAFALSPLGELDPEAPKILKLPRAVAQEFQLAAALAPVACSDVAAPFADRLYATDASEAKGACVSAPLPEHLRAVLWATADRKGAYARVCSPAQALLRRADPMFEESPEAEESSPERPLAFLFDFLALGPRAGEVLKSVAERGWSVGPLISRDDSPHYCLSLPRLLDWVFYLVDEDRVRAIYVAAPVGEDLAPFRHTLAILMKARAADVAFIAEAPFFLQGRAQVLWQGILGVSGVQTCTAATCAFGSPFLKRLRFIAVGCSLAPLAKDCSCSLPHRPAKGPAARPDFVPRSGLSHCVGRVFHQALRERSACLRETDLGIAGLERTAPSDLALSLNWETDQVWRWKGQVHINILEASALARLFTSLAIKGGPLRFVNLCDSHVARAAVSKGRSASPGLRHATRRSSTVALAAGLYHGGMYCPTRLIPADNPTRDRPFEPPVLALGPSFWDEDKLLLDASRPRLRRWASNWVRLVFAVRPAVAALPLLPDSGRYASLPFRAFSRPVAFDSTFGFPGEGPTHLLWISCLAFGLLFGPLRLPAPCGLRLQGCFGFLVLVEPAAAMEAARTKKTESQRKEARAGTVLEKGRPMLPSTRSRREKLQEFFEEWLRERGRTWAGLQALAKHDVEQLNEILIWYGQWLYAEGKPYYHLSETINMFSLACPQVRRQLQPAWDICFFVAAAGAPGASHGPPMANLAGDAFHLYALGMDGRRRYPGNLLGRPCSGGGGDCS